jgi:predicted ArsR family transcriptional regulator
MIPGWLDAIEAEVVASLGPRGSASARELADSLGVSEACALGYITLLASAGRLRIEAVSRPRGAGGYAAAGEPVAHAA